MEVTFAGAGVRLAGSITWPDSAGTSCGVILIGGSGPSGRHNDWFFDLIIHHLAAVGVAVLAYDKRGVDKSTGAWAGSTVDDLARDAAALALLRSHPPGSCGWRWSPRPR
jgi:pimeloyl-ACP methyl ester carboxylesterase